MEPLAHIDIRGDRRIEQILQDPANAVVEAVTCETLGGWVPDIGLTTYSHRSIYRPPVLARSGLATTLAHRFWRTSEGLMDHTGTRWIGVLIYDQDGERCPLELHVAGRPVGRLEPTRHDNRRHLIVADRPVEFFGGMEVFQLTAPGSGTYRIEALVFLAARPAPSSFVPAIRHLTARSHDTGTEVHFITDHVARAEVVARSGETVVGQSRSDLLTKLHVLRLKDLPPGDYRCEVIATGIAGETDRASLDVALHADTASPGAPARAGQEVAVPVEIVDAAGAGRAAGPGMPATFGVPLPRGQLHGAMTGRLQAGGVSTVAQCRVHSPWPDGSARWVLVDAVVPAAFPPEGRITGTLKLTPGAVPGRSERTDSSLIQAGDHLRIEIDPERPAFPAGLSKRSGSGGWRQVVATRREDSTQGRGCSASAVEICLANGAALVPHCSAPGCEELGPERSVLRYQVDHCDRDGTPHLRSVVRIHLYRSQRHVRIQHRLDVVSPALGPAAGDPDQAPVPVESGAAARGIAGADRGSSTATPADVAACVGSGPGEENTLLEIGSAVAHIAIPGIQALVAGGRRHELTADGHWRLVQADDRGYRVEATDDPSTATAAEGRFSGRLLLESEEGLVGLAVRRFWQTYPKGLRVDATGATVELLPALTPLPAAGKPGVADDDSWHQIFFWRTSRGYLLKAGQALTSEITVSLPDSPAEAERIAAWCEQPAVVRPGIDWLNRSGALSPIRAKSDSPHPRYERTVDHACDEWLRERDNLRQYGFLNFGDWYGESGWSWGNNEYDPAFAHYQEFLRGGRAEWAVLAAESVRATWPTSTPCNFSSDAAQIGGPVRPHARPRGRLPAALLSQQGRRLLHVLLPLVGGGPGAPLPAQRRRERARDARPHRRMDAERPYTRRSSAAAWWRIGRGWTPTTTVSSAMPAGTSSTCAPWRAGPTIPRFTNAAHLVAERLLERRTPGGGWERLLGEGHCFAGPPRTRGEASFMVGVCLSALRRYHELTGRRAGRDRDRGRRPLAGRAHLRPRRAPFPLHVQPQPRRQRSGPHAAGHRGSGVRPLPASRRRDRPHRSTDWTPWVAAARRRAAGARRANASTSRGVGRRSATSRYVPTMLAYLPLGAPPPTGKRVYRSRATRSFICPREGSHSLHELLHELG